MDITLGSFSLSISAWMLIAFCAIIFLVFRIRKKRKEGGQSEPKHIVTLDTVSDIKTPNTIAMLRVRGPILSDSAGVPRFMRKFVALGDKIYHALALLAVNENISAVLVCFNTPGGTVIGSEKIGSGIELCKTKKKVIAHIGDLSASGGVYSMVAADQIFADENALTGSIGVIGPTLFHYENVTALGEGAFGKNVVAGKVIARSIASGKGKALGNPFVEWDEEAANALQNVIDNSCERFQARVARLRNIPMEKIKEIGAHIFDAAKALEIGLIDGILSEKDAKTGLIEALNKERKAEHVFVEIKNAKEGGIFSTLSDMFWGSVAAFGGNPTRMAHWFMRGVPLLMLWRGAQEE